MCAFRRYSQNCLQGLVHLAIRAPWSTVVTAVVLAGLALWVTATRLEFETSRNALASSDAPYIQLYNELKADFGQLDYIVVVVEPTRLARGKQFVRALSARLRADTRHFEAVIDRVDTQRLEGKKLLLLSPQELRTLRQRLDDARDFISDVARSPGLGQLLTSINQEISKALVSHLTGGLLGLSTSKTPATETAAAGSSLDVSFLEALFTEMNRALETPDSYQYESPWTRFFLEDGAIFSQDGYLTSKNNRFLFVLVDDRVTKGSLVKHAIPLRLLRQHLQALRQDFPDVQAGVTGGKALSNDEMLAAQRDTIVATAIALVGVAVLFIVAFRQVRRPLLVVAMLVVAVCWAMGFTTLTVGHLNILSVAFMPILIGLGIDFGIHLLARYGEERAHQQDFAASIRTAYWHTGPSVVAAALTTALAFYAIMLADFRGLVELGFIAGSGMLLCLLASFTVLPALLALGERHQRPQPGVWKASSHDPLQGLKRFPRTLLGLIVLLTLAGIFLEPLPKFDYNLLNMQARGTESVVWEHRLREGSGRSSWFALSVATSLDELYQKKARFNALPAVDRVASLASVVPPDQDVRLPLVRELAPYVRDLPATWDQPEPVDLDELNLMLRKIRFKLQRKASDWDPNKRPSEAQLTAARNALLDLQERLRTIPAETVRDALETFQQALLADFADKLTLLQRNVDPTPITLQDVPVRLRQRFVSKTDRFLLQVFARDNIWERDAMQTFVSQLQSVDPEVTGPPVVAFYSIQHMLRGYTRGAISALLVISGVIWFLFRRLKPTLLAMVPMVLGGFWAMVCMALLDLQLNMANLIVLPLYLGIAVDDGIHLVHRMLESPEDATSPLARSTGKAILLTSLTSIVGFGSLMLAHHFGVFSLGVLATLGVGFALIATLGVLPLILRILPPTSPPSPRRRLPLAPAMPDVSSRS